MPQQLPEDIWHLVFEELRLRRDFQTLFNSAQLSKQLAPLALINLYRVANQSPGSDEEGEGVFSLVNQGEESHFLKWIVFWSSLIQSGLKNTLFPYVSYLRSLDLRDLENMFSYNKFAKHEQRFFKGNLSKFHKLKAIKVRSGTVMRLDSTEIIEQLGEMLTQHIPLLEQLSGSFSSEALLRWIPRLPKLMRLELWTGETLGKEEVHSAIYQHCPHFSELSIYLWHQDDADKQMGNFLHGLPEQSLRALTTISDCHLLDQTFSGLNRHGTSLRELELSIGADAVPYMGLLQDCKAIEKLHLEMPATINLEVAFEDVFKDVVAWLGGCTKLKEIELMEFTCGPSLLLPVLLNDQIHLEDLSINGQKGFYALTDGRDFHFALSQQRSLRSLVLKGEGEEIPTADTEVLVDSISQITGLKKLQIRGLADSFDDDRIIRILTSLKQLEEVYIGGWNITDEVLTPTAKLPMLKSITFNALTAFTVAGLLDFVAQVPFKKDGLWLSVDNADPASPISDEEVQLVREAMAVKFGDAGRFDYILVRDPDAPEFDESDSD